MSWKSVDEAKSVAVSLISLKFDDSLYLIGLLLKKRA